MNLNNILICVSQGLAIGNLTAEEASALATEVSEAVTPARGLPAAEWPTDRVMRLLPGGARARGRVCAPHHNSRLRLHNSGGDGLRYLEAKRAS